MTQIKKMGLFDINDSMEFLKLKENIDKFMEKIKNNGGEQELYNLAKSRPFSVAMYVNEIEKLLKKIEDGLKSYGLKDQYVSKELGQMKIKLVNLKENLKTR